MCFPVTRKKEQPAVLKRRIIAWREKRKGSERWSTGEGGVEGTVLLYFLLQELSTGLYLSSSAGELAITSNPRSKTVVVGSSSLVSGLNMFLVTATRFCVPPPPLALVEDFCHSLKLREGKRVSCPCTETEPPLNIVWFLAGAWESRKSYCVLKWLLLFLVFNKKNSLKVILI